MINQFSSSADKIALFRSLFRGREDVYPQRFESSKTGKSGYSPACANEWVRVGKGQAFGRHNFLVATPSVLAQATAAHQIKPLGERGLLYRAAALEQKCLHLNHPSASQLHLRQ